MTTITPIWADNPPHVTITVTGMPTGTATMTITRIVGTHETTVRGADRSLVAGTSGLVVDWDAPVGQTITYRVDCWSAGGGALTGGVAIGQATTGGIDCDTAWISDPLDPSTGMHVTLMAGSDDEVSHDQQVSLSTPRWSTHLPSAVVGGRQLGGKRTLVVRLDTLDAAQHMEDMLASAVMILVRAPAIRHRTGSLYMVPATVTEHRERDYADNPGHTETTWTLTGDEVDPGRMPVMVAPWTYADARSYAATRKVTTYRALPTLWATYLDVQRGVY